jgi:hypothetical protein
MTCKDCVHYDVCYLIETYGADDNELCNHFKNKADFVEVKHGEWIENDYRTFDGFETVVYPNEALKCSNCNHNFKKELLWCKNYCPECGADMRKGENNGK